MVDHPYIGSRLGKVTEVVWCHRDACAAVSVYVLGPDYAFYVLYRCSNVDVVHSYHIENEMAYGA